MTDAEKRRRKYLIYGASAFGIGSLISSWILKLCNRQIPHLKESLEQLTEQPELTESAIFEGCLLLIGICVLFAVPAMAERGWKNTARLIAAVFFVVMDSVGMLVCAIQGRMLISVMLLLWVTAVFLVWQIIKLTERLSVWVKSTKPNEKYDIGKLSLLWAVVAFLIGLVI